MGKGRKGSTKTGGSSKRSSNTGGGNVGPQSPSSKQQQQSSSPNQMSVYEWVFVDFRGVKWVMISLFFGSMFGCIFGDSSYFPEHMRIQIARNVRSMIPYQLIVRRGPFYDKWSTKFSKYILKKDNDLNNNELDIDTFIQNPAHPKLFAILREAVIREKGGYVHPDLGILHPAPCGAVRGIGMVRDGYYKCQSKCFPSTIDERIQLENQRIAKNNTKLARDEKYKQEDVLIRIPLSYQMTRTDALDTMLRLLPDEMPRRANLNELDDAAVLVLYLAHERGVGKSSRWFPYILSLPTQPSCGYSREVRPYMIDAIQAYTNELHVETEGWEDELLKALQYSDRIAESLNNEFGSYIQSPEGVTSLQNIKWSLCQVASRATAGSDKHGSLRLIPILDLINHNINAGGFVELTGKERIENDDFLNANEDDSGTFIVRSLRHGRKKPLKKGQELLVNYNVPHYTPLDWFISLGFVPEERWTPWQKINPVLPPVRRDGPFEEETKPTDEILKAKDALLLKHMQESEL